MGRWLSSNLYPKICLDFKGLRLIKASLEGLFSPKTSGVF